MARLPALRYPNYRRYLAGNFLSNTGTQVQSAALAYHIYLLTGSSYAVGLLGLVRVVPLLTFTLFGGVLADQADRRRVMLVTQTVMALCSLVLAYAEWGGHATPKLIFAIVGFSFIAVAFDGPARQSLVVSLVPAQHFPNAASVNGIAWRLSDVIGPVAAGLLIASGENGLAICYGLNAVSFIAVIYAVWRLPPTPPVGGDDDRPKSVRDVFRQIGDGWRFVNRTPLIRHAMWIDFWATFFSAADALLPALSKMLNLGPQGYGLLSASAAVGAFLAAGVLAYRPTIQHQGRWVVAMVGVYGVATVGLAFSPTLAIAALCLAVTGAADMVSTVMRQTIRQLATPDSMRGRMTSISSLFFISGPRLGDYEAGTVARFTGERASIAIGGIACMGVSALWSRARALRDYEHKSTD